MNRLVGIFVRRVPNIAADCKYRCFHVVFFQQWIRNGIIALVSIVECNTYRLVRQGFALVHKIHELFHGNRFVLLFLKQSKITFKRIRRESPWIFDGIGEMMEHQNRNSHFGLFLKACMEYVVICCKNDRCVFVLRQMKTVAADY